MAPFELLTSSFQLLILGKHLFQKEQKQLRIQVKRSNFIK